MRRKRISGYTYKRNGKTITVKSYLRHVKHTKQTRKKSRPEIRPEKTKRHDRTGKGKGIPGREKGRVSKQVKISIPPKSNKSRGGKGKARRSVGETQITVRHPRNKQEIELDFKAVRSVERKKDSFQRSEKIRKAIDSQLRRKDGRPPLGFIITFTDKDGRTASKIAPPEMVVNADNVIKIMVERMTELDENYDPDFADSGEGEDEEGYKDYDPSGINNVVIEFFYGK